MRYLETDFFPYEQPLINQLRSEGYFVYGIRNCEGSHFSIEKHVLVNNTGFLITDKELTTPLSYSKLCFIGEEDGGLHDEIMHVRKKINDILLKSKADYESKAKEREDAWKEVLEIQNNRMERDKYYKLSIRKDNPVILPDGHAIVFQTIYNNGNGTQEVMYFIRDPQGKIVTDSTKATFNLNARYKIMAGTIAKSHGLTA